MHHCEARAWGCGTWVLGLMPVAMAECVGGGGHQRGAAVGKSVLAQ